ncbi:MAG: hypothetical protein ACM33B_03290 [Pseudomonadota bacterium]
MRLLAAVIAAAAVAVPTAAAAPPTVVTHEDVDFTRTIGVCGFPVIAHSVGVFTVWQWYDESGALVKERAHVEQGYTITWTNPANGRSIDTVLGGPVVVEYAPDGSYTQTVMGRERLYIAPGQGPVAMQVGRIVFEVAADGTETVPFVAGRWDLDIFPELCAYLA